MALWQVSSTGSNYVDMKTPSSYSIDYEDLDSNSYRSVSTGNLNRYIIGKKWISAKFDYNYLTEAEAETILQKLNYYPMYVKLKSPLFGTSGIWEGQMYCSKASIEMQSNANNSWTSLSFTLVQSIRKSSQL